MSLAAINYGHWEFWGTYDPQQGFYGEQKVAFDGPNKIIYVAEGVTELNVKEDIYSAWKEWILGSVESPPASNWDQAFIAVGGDPITATESLGITYFLENGWRIQPFASKQPYLLRVNGNIYTREEGGNPFLFAEGVSIALTRSNLVDQVTVASNLTAAEFWAYAVRTLTTNAPTAVEIRQEIDSNSSKLQEISTKQDEALTKGDFIALS